MKKAIRAVSVFAVFAMVFTVAASASAGDHGHHWRSNNIVVKNWNQAEVLNEVVSRANTGGNSADAMVGGGHGHGNDVLLTSGEGDHHHGGARSFAKGGMIKTGDADAGAEVMNQVGWNETILRLNQGECGCQRGNVKVMNRNQALVGNAVMAAANTGWNSADANAYGKSEGHKTYKAKGGKIMTGDAASWAGVTNVIGYNYTKIVR